MRNLSIFILAAIVSAGCKTPEEQLVGKPPTGEEEVVRRPTAVGESHDRSERPEYPDPVLVLETWPYVEDRKSFVLTWDGGDNPVPIHLKPDPNSRILGEAVWRNGEEIGWQASVVAIYQPSVMPAKEEWFVEGPVYEEGYITEQEYVSETLRNGQRIEVYLYAGAGRCWLGLDGKIFQGVCPPKEKFSGSFQGNVPAQWYQPARKVWWIEVSTDMATGWFPMDDRVIVDIVDQ
jgi:hypothetical protein